MTQNWSPGWKIINGHRMFLVSSKTTATSRRRTKKPSCTHQQSRTGRRSKKPSYTFPWASQSVDWEKRRAPQPVNTQLIKRNTSWDDSSLSKKNNLMIELFDWLWRPKVNSLSIHLNGNNMHYSNYGGLLCVLFLKSSVLFNFTVLFFPIFGNLSDYFKDNICNITIIVKFLSFCFESLYSYLGFFLLLLSLLLLVFICVFVCFSSLNLN